MVLPEAEDFTISLYTIEGKLLYTEASSGMRYSGSIDTKEFGNGFYHLTIDSDLGRLNKRVTVKH
jgi:hypothetical protein